MTRDKPKTLFGFIKFELTDASNYGLTLLVLWFQVMSQEIQEAVYKQQEVIKDKQLSVKEDLDQVEPAVIEAQNGTVVYLLTAALYILFVKYIFWL